MRGALEGAFTWGSGTRLLGIRMNKTCKKAYVSFRMMAFKGVPIFPGISGGPLEEEALHWRLYLPTLDHTVLTSSMKPLLS